MIFSGMANKQSTFWEYMVTKNVKKIIIFTIFTLTLYDSTVLFNNYSYTLFIITKNYI